MHKVPILTYYHPVIGRLPILWLLDLTIDNTTVEVYLSILKNAPVHITIEVRVAFIGEHCSRKLMTQKGLFSAQIACRVGLESLR